MCVRAQVYVCVCVCNANTIINNAGVFLFIFAFNFFAFFQWMFAKIPQRKQMFVYAGSGTPEHRCICVRALRYMWVCAMPTSWRVFNIFVELLFNFLLFEIPLFLISNSLWYSLRFICIRTAHLSISIWLRSYSLLWQLRTLWCNCPSDVFDFVYACCGTRKAMLHAVNELSVC